MLRHIVVTTLATGVVLAMVPVSASACKGTTTLFSDNFTTKKPAWQTYWSAGGTFDVSGGQLVLQSILGSVQMIEWGGDFFAEADVCVDVVLPSQDKSQGQEGINAGLAFVGGDGAVYMATVNFDQTVGVSKLTSAGWLSPIPEGKLDVLKTGPKAVNTVRLTWKGPPAAGVPGDSTVSFYVNDKLVNTFDAQPNANRLIGLVGETAGDTATFSKLLITK